MKHLFSEQLRLAINRKNPHEQFNHLIPVIRSITQHAAIGAYEKFDKIGQLDDQEAHTVLHLLRNPNDSSPIDVLNRIIPHIRASGHSRFCYGWYEMSSDADIADKMSLSNRLNKWITFRNKTHHTIADSHIVTTALPELYICAQYCLRVLHDALPEHTEGENLSHTIGGLSFFSTTLRLYHDQPIVIRTIRSRRGIWSVQFRTLNLEHSEDGSYELEESPILAPVVPSPNAFVTRKYQLNPKVNSFKYGQQMCLCKTGKRFCLREGNHKWKNYLIGIMI